MGKKHKRERERDCDYQSIALREESKVSSTNWPQQSSDLFSVQARVTRGSGEGNSHSCLICRIFRESVSFCHLKIRVDLVSLCFEISRAGNLRWRIKVKRKE